MSAARESVEVWVPSAISSTAAVVLVDVLAIWAVHHSLHQVAAFLSARNVLGKGKAVCVSELWFEGLVGRTHGPPWFRYTQALVKLAIFVASVVLSLSLNGSTRPRVATSGGHTILIQRPRTLQNIGLGQKDPLSRIGNFSQELIFTLQLFECSNLEPTGTQYNTYRALKPLQSKNYSEFFPVPVECLTEARGFAHPPILDVPFDQLSSNCSIKFPTKSQIRTGNITASATECIPSSIEIECALLGPEAACVAFVTDERGKWIIIGKFDGEESVQRDHRFDQLPLARNNETVKVMATIAAHDPRLRPLNLIHATYYQAGLNRDVYKIVGERSITEISIRLFAPSATIIATLVLGSGVLGMFSMLAMILKGRYSLELGFSPEEVARLATAEYGTGEYHKSWFLKLHPSLPTLTISTDRLVTGEWSETDVINRHRKRG